MELTCPHCHKAIDVLEPKDLDALGLGQNIRAPLIKDGDLPPWAVLRSGKFFLFLRDDVTAVIELRNTEKGKRWARDAGAPEGTEEEYWKVMSEALKKAGLPLPGDGEIKTRVRRSQTK